MLNERKLLESLVGYGDWGDEDFPDNHNFHKDLIKTLGYKSEILDKVYECGEDKEKLSELMRYNLYDIGDILNFLYEITEQLEIKENK